MCNAMLWVLSSSDVGVLVLYAGVLQDFLFRIPAILKFERLFEGTVPGCLHLLLFESRCFLEAGVALPVVYNEAR